MNKYFWISLALIMSLSVNVSFAQKKTKEEVALEKEWAKKLKLVKPLDYKQLVEEKDALAAQASEAESAKSELSSAKSQLESKDAEIAKLKKELEDYSSGSVPTAAGDSASGSEGYTTRKGPSSGVIYKVQVGSFRSKDLTQYFDNNPNFSGDVDADGTKKYTLGAFKDYWEADKFKKALREMGVQGAWIVPYKNGQRVDIKDVLEGTL